MSSIRAVGLFCFGVLAGVGCLPPAQNPEAKHFVQGLESKTVALTHIQDDGTAKPYCSGVWVGAKTILTAAHCIGEWTLDFSYAVKSDVLHGVREFDLPEARLARLTVLDEDHDLALLEARGQTPPHEVAEVSLWNTFPGAKAFTMGHPIGLWWSYSSGEVASIRFIDASPSMVYVQTTAPCSRGNSGGGLFDVDGNLMGLAHAVVPPHIGANLGFYVHGQYIHDLLVQHPPQ
jgi:S1-C subfamily serine protease